MAHGIWRKTTLCKLRLALISAAQSRACTVRRIPRVPHSVPIKSAIPSDTKKNSFADTCQCTCIGRRVCEPNPQQLSLLPCATVFQPFLNRLSRLSPQQVNVRFLIGSLLDQGGGKPSNIVANRNITPEASQHPERTPASYKKRIQEKRRSPCGGTKAASTDTSTRNKPAQSSQQKSPQHEEWSVTLHKQQALS